MGYDVHITRKEDWSDDSGPSISRDEWIGYVGDDKSMRLDREAVVENAQGEAFSVQDETLAVWTEWTSREEGKNEAWMWCSHGNVMAKNPDGAILQKMFLIADSMGAKLQGDDGEVYNSIGEVDAADQAKKPWWKIW
ncbi:MAG: hypothetical protein ACR2O1_16110 [Boseongicola sp.]